MKNSEKYLKVSVNDFFKAIIESKIDISGLYSLEKWLLDEAKPTLTEDERVILKLIKSSENYKTYKEIGRTTYGSLYLVYDLNKETARELGELETDFAEFDMYNDLFQFIKERRRIFY